LKSTSQLAGHGFPGLPFLAGAAWSAGSQEVVALPFRLISTLSELRQPALAMPVSHEKFTCAVALAATNTILIVTKK